MDFRIIEFEQFSVHDATTAHRLNGRAFRQEPRLDVTRKAVLRGRVGRGIGGSCGKDILIGHFEKRDPIGPDIEASTDQRFFNRQHAATVILVVRVPALEGAVDKEGDRTSGLDSLPVCVSASCHRCTPFRALLSDSRSICCPDGRPQGTHLKRDGSNGEVT